MERTWEASDAEPVFLALGKMGGITEDALEFGYEQMRARAPWMPDWPTFLDDLSSSPTLGHYAAQIREANYTISPADR